MKRLLLVALVLAVCVFVGCGGSSSGGNNNPPPVTLQLIAVTPATPSINVGATQQFKATGTYSDGSTKDLSATANWLSSNPSVASINSPGLAEGLSGGTTTISAASSGITGTTTITVVALQSITVTPATATVAPNGTEQYTATGNYSDGSTQNLTSSVSWSATAGATITSGGLATGITPGATVTIAAAVLHLQIVGFAMLTVANPPPPLSSSKLGPHILGDPNNAGAITILDACPRVAKWVVPYAGTDRAISYYKSHCPAGTVILRVYVSPSMAAYTTANDPVPSANDFWNKMLAQGLSSAGQPNQIDWLEGPNELDNLPNWYNDPNTATWVASFWSALADLMHNAGYNPLVGSLLAGQPSPVTVFAPVVAAMKSKGYKWGWSYHSYTFGATMNVGTERDYALYYRQVRDQNGLAGIPLVLTEGGYLTPNSTGWHGHLTNDQYLSWLEWFDAQLKQDPEVSGFTIFQVGNTTDWQSFDLTPIAPDLANYLTTGS